MSGQAHPAMPLARWIGWHLEQAGGDVDRALTAMADELRDRLDVDPDDAVPTVATWLAPPPAAAAE